MPVRWLHYIAPMTSPAPRKAPAKKRPIKPLARQLGYHHGDLRRALVTAARRIIETRGPAKLTLRETARVAGVSVAAPYRHFADMDALLATVLAEGFDELAAALEQARRGADSPAAGLPAVGKAYLAFAAAHAPVYRLMFSPLLDKTEHPELMAAGERALGVLMSTVIAGQKAGEVTDADPRLVALSGWSMCHGLASLHSDGVLASVMPVDLNTVAPTILDLLERGIARHGMAGSLPRDAETAPSTSVDAQDQEG
jgi:AcrR family transcriptional regulator